MSPSWRRWEAVTGLLCPLRSDSARNRIDVSGDRRSWAISTTSSSPLGPARLDAKSSDSAADPGSCQRSSTAVAVICVFPLASCFLRHAAAGQHGFLGRRRLALDDPARAGTALEPVPSHQAVQRRAVYAGDRSEEHTSELQSQSNLVCRLLLEKKKLSQNNETRR